MLVIVHKHADAEPEHAGEDCEAQTEKYFKHSLLGNDRGVQNLTTDRRLYARSRHGSNGHAQQSLWDNLELLADTQGQ